MTPRVGDLVRSKYRIARLIGDGGMGSVFEARHEGLGSQVALKFLHSELARRPGLAQRFSREARVSAAISSPHVTRVTDVDTTEDGTPFLVMELLGGQSLGLLLDASPDERPNRDQSIDFALQILAGLEAAHALGVVHRDLKPDNVFITPSAGGPVAKLIDFGIAKVKESGEYKQGLTFAGILMGTPEYMAPEQLFSANTVDHRADLYSLGVMLFEMLAGERPAQGDSPSAIIAQVQNGTAKRLERLVPDLSAELVSVVHTAISADPSERFDSAFAMRMALARCAGALSHAGQLAATASPATAPSRPPQPKTDPPPPYSAVPKTVPPGALAPSLAPAVAEPVAPPHAATPSILSAPAPELWAQSQVPMVPRPASAEPPMGRTARASGTVMTMSPTPPPAVVASIVAPPVAGGQPLKPRTQAGPLPWILGGLAFAIAAAAGVVALRQVSDEDPSSAPARSVTPIPASAVSAQREELAQVNQQPKGATVQPERAPEKAHSAKASRSPTAEQTPRNTPASDASPTPAGSASSPLNLPFALPSTLPPLPSNLPALPAGIPTSLPSSFPTFPDLAPPPETPEKPQSTDPATGQPSADDP